LPHLLPFPYGVIAMYGASLTITSSTAFYW